MDWLIPVAFFVGIGIGHRLHRYDTASGERLHRQIGWGYGYGRGFVDGELGLYRPGAPKDGRVRSEEETPPVGEHRAHP